MSCEVIAISNQKGGVGKTTTSLNLGIALNRQGKKVLLIDSDPQGDLTTCLGINDSELELTLADLMTNVIQDEIADTKKAIIHTKEGIDIIPGNLDLSAIEFSLVNAMSREFVIKSVIQDIKKDYDYIIIDSMPSLGMLTINCLACSDKVIIPVQDHFLAAKGMGHLLKTISRVKRTINPNLKIGGILLTLVNKRTNISKETTNNLKENFESTPYFGSKVTIYNTQIPFGIKVAESTSRGKSIFIYDKNSKVATAYDEFSKEVLSNNERKREENLYTR